MADFGSGLVDAFSQKLDSDRQRRREQAIQDKGLAQADTLFQEGQQDREHNLGRQAIDESRGDEQYAEQHAAFMAAAKHEGAVDMVTMLQKGVPANQVEDYVNNQGKGIFKIKPGTLKYDPKSTSVTYTNDQGQTYNGTIKQMQDLLNMQPPSKYSDVHDVADGGKLFALNHLTGKWELVGDNPKDPKAGDGDSKYNEQKAFNDINGRMAQNLGGNYEPETGKYTVPEGSSARMAAYTDLGERFERKHPGKLAPGEVGDIIFQAGKDSMLTKEDAAAQAQKEAEAKAGYTTTDAQDFASDPKDPLTSTVQSAIKDNPKLKPRDAWVQARADQIYQQGLQKTQDTAEQLFENRLNHDMGGDGQDGGAPAGGQPQPQAAPQGAGGGPQSPKKPGMAMGPQVKSSALLALQRAKTLEASKPGSYKAAVDELSRRLTGMGYTPDQVNALVQNGGQ